MKRFLLVLAIGLVCFFYFKEINAGNDSGVLLNEIAWMGNANSANDEWLELFNNTNQDINLSGWTLKSADEKLKISLKGVILANQFYLLERTDEQSVPELKADLIYTGAINNSGLNLKLYGSLGNLVDEANYLNGWPAGDNETKQTMERVNLTSWQTSQNPNGTPKAKNSIGALKKELVVVDKTKKAAINSLSETKKFDNKNTGVFAAAINLGNQLNPLLIFKITGAVILITAGITLLLKIKRK